MRVISQGGKIDVPYEQISIEVRDNEIWCGYNATLGKDCIAKRFAIYSTEEKAEKAMQKLHECYTGVLLIQNVSFPEDEAEQLKNMTTGFICVNSREDNVRIEPLHMVFRFPQEDEL